MLFNNRGISDRQPLSCPMPNFLGGEKKIENFWLDFCGNILGGEKKIENFWLDFCGNTVPRI